MYKVIVNNIEFDSTGNESTHTFVWGIYRTKLFANRWAKDLFEGVIDYGSLGYTYSYPLVEKV